MASYSVFVRNWWKKNPNRPGGKEPGPGRKSYLARKLDTEEEARTMAQEYNRTHEPGWLSRKAEFEKD